MRKTTVKKLAIFMLTLVFCAVNLAIPAIAESNADVESLIDYRADSAKINKNLIPDASATYGYKYLCVNNQYEVTYDTALNLSELDGMCRWYLRDGIEQLDLSQNYKGFAGFELNNSDRDGGERSFGFSAENGKTYVLSMRLKNGSSSGIVPHFGAAMNNSSFNGDSVCYTNEYGAEGMAVESDGWQDFKATITLPEDYVSSAPESTSNYKDRVYIGYPNMTLGGSMVYVDVSEKDSVYFAEEQPYDISVLAESTVITDKTSVKLSAEVVNQLGIKGGLVQDFDWYALKGDKSAEETGIKFIGNGASVEAVWGTDLENGEYIIAAKSKVYDGFVRTVRIIITDKKLSDSFGTVPNNLIPDASDGNGFKYLCVNNQYEVTYDTEQTPDGRAGYSNVWYLREGTGTLSMQDSVKYKGFAGFTLNQARDSGDGAFGFVPENGETYVISANLKNASANGIVPCFGAAMNNSWGESTIVYTNEYGKEGMAIDSKDWLPFRATITIPSNYNNSNTYKNVIYLGIPDKTKEGARFYVDASNKDSVYFAKETPWQIKLTCNADENLSVGDVIDVKAEVINQIGIKGTLNQELGWLCISRDGSRTLNGFDIAPYDGGAKITVNSAENLSDLRIMAMSAQYGLAASAYPAKSGEKRTIYVSETGSDTASGEADAPLATLKGARDRVRTIRSGGFDGDVDVIFSGGRYYFDDSVSFDSEDFAEGKTVYKAAADENVVFTGGFKLDASKMTKVTDSSILNRVKEDVRGKLWEINLAEQGFPYSFTEDDAMQPTISELCGNAEYPALYADGSEQQLAQWPNGHGNYASYGYVSSDTMSYTDDEPSLWTGADGWWVGGYLSRDFDYIRTPALSVDAAAKTIRVSTNANSGIEVKENPSDSIKKSWRWKAYNLLEELDMPTEWYIDKSTMKLYYYMPESLKNSDFEISALKTPLVRITDNKNISFENITFENTRGGAIEACGVDSVFVKNCDFKNIGTCAVNIFGTKRAQTDMNYWQRQMLDAAYNCKISDCRFDNIGGSAVKLDGGNVDTLAKGNNIIENNLFFMCSQKIKAHEAIIIKGCGNSVLHNNISRADFQGIRHYGNDHIIKYNEIHDVIQETDDCGAIYGGRNTLQRGTETAYNYIHDIKGTYTPTFAHKTAIYWDDNQTGMYAHHNIINNAYINVYTNGIDNRYEYNTSVNIEKTNIDFKDGGAASNDNVDSAKFSSNIANPELYYAAYPNLQRIVESESRTDRTLAALNIIKGNVCVNGPGANGGSANGIGEYTLKPVQQLFWWTAGDNISDNHDSLTTENAPFVDVAKQDFRFKGYANPDLNNPYEGSFDINLIGIQSDNSPEKTAPEAVYPCSEQVAPGTVRFIWSDAFGATSYTVSVAYDSEFKSIAAQANSYYNFADIDIPQSTETLYWKVTAHNTSRQFDDNWESAVYEFSNGARIDSFSEINNDKTVSAHIVNNYYDRDSLYALLVQYSADGAVVDVEIKNVTGDKGKEEILDFTRSTEKAKNVKLMLLTRNYTPAAKSVSVK